MISPTLKTIGLTKTFKVGPQLINALCQADIEAYPGDFIAIMGPSGSGKTTLLSMLGCMDKPTSGRIILDGLDVTEVQEASLHEIRREKVGFVFQSLNLIENLNALENVELPMENTIKSRRERKQRATKLIEDVGLADRIKHKPNQLSSGEQQRVAIARALANDPVIILADEPTANLDSVTGRGILQILQRQCLDQKRTVIMVTHDLRMSDFASKKFSMADGIIAKDRSSETPRSETQAPIENGTQQDEELTPEDIEKILNNITDPVMREKTRQYLRKQKNR